MKNKNYLTILSFLFFAQASLASVLIVATDSAADIADVQNKIIAAGVVTGAVDTFNSPSTITLAQVQAYDSVFFYHDFNSSLTVTGNVLADYVDGGGGVVVAVFGTASGPLAGRWLSGGYNPINTTGQTFGPQLTLGTVNIPTHPIMNGVTTFDGGTGSWRSTGGVAAGASLIAEWSNGDPLIAELTGFTGKVVALNMFPPSTDSGTNSGFWVPSTDGGLMMANAVQYVSFAPSIITPSVADMTTINVAVPGNTSIDFTNSGGANGSLDSCSLASGALFSVTAPAAFPMNIAGGGTITVTAAIAGTVSGSDTLNCSFTDSNGTTAVSYTLVGVDTSVIAPSVADMTTINVTVPGNTSIDFTNTGGTNGSLDSCSLTSGALFSITAPASFPANVVAGGTVTVTAAIAGTVSGSDTLNCSFTDSNGTTAVSYTLVGVDTSLIAPSVADMATINVAVPGNTSIDFINSGGTDGSLDSCSLASGALFSVTAPAAFPANVVAGGTVAVTVAIAGTVSGSDTLNCSFTDSNGTTAVSYTLVGIDTSLIAPSVADMATINVAVPGNTSIDFINSGGTDGSLDSCSLASGALFSVTAPAAFPANVVAGGTVAVTVAIAGTISGSDTLNCSFTDSLGTTNVSYNIVGTDTSLITPDIPDMSLISFLVPGDSSVVFANTGGTNGSLDSCSLASGTTFSITSPAGFPVVVPAGSNVIVTVAGTVVGADTLTCSYTDSTGTVAVSYAIQGHLPPPIPVPFLNKWLLFAMVLLLLIGGVFRVHQRQ